MGFFKGFGVEVGRKEEGVYLIVGVMYKVVYDLFWDVFAFKLLFNIIL